VVSDGHDFCCNGCKTVHDILSVNGLSDYYRFEDKPGISFANRSKEEFAYLDAPEVLANLYTFEQDDMAEVVLRLPEIHCSSCIWLLENLNKLHPGVLQTRVQFLQKEASIRFDKEVISLRELAELLDSIGYKPDISLESGQTEKSEKRKSNALILKIAVAGFCFGNAMLFSFPEYFGLNSIYDAAFKQVFGYLNFVLAIPALLYSGRDYLVSAWKAMRKRVVHINVPLALGMTALFARSTYEIFSGTGAGYFDSLTGLIFFLLVGKWFQERTYEHISFDRDYRSYFPLAVTRVEDGKEEVTLLDKLKEGDRIRIKSGELIPADGILLNGKGMIDYSFVTGESVPLYKGLGEMLYAGGRQTEGILEMELTREVSQSKLTRLWNLYDSGEKETGLKTFTDKVSKYFTIGLILIATVTLTAWAFIDVSTAFFAFTSVLIVACPCALALSMPFATGNAMRIFGKNEFYLKNTGVVERMSRLTRVVFDKTGTITDRNAVDVKYRGKDLNDLELDLIYTLTRSSNHPLSQAVNDQINGELIPLDEVREFPGKGLQGKVGDLEISMGSHAFVAGEKAPFANTHVAVSIDGQLKGHYFIQNHYRFGLKAMLGRLRSMGMQLALFSGDGESEKKRIRSKFPQISDLRFNCEPEDKLHGIESFGKKEHVLMVGDGLNDAGALAASEVGLVVSEEVNNFTPAADGIMRSDQLLRLPDYLRFSKTVMKVIYVSFGLSILYNIVGIGFAVQGMLSPVVAAILMPLSSISVVVFNTITTNIIARRRGLL